MKKVILLIITFHILIFSHKSYSIAGEKKDHTAVKDLIQRIIGETADNIMLIDAFQSDTSDAYQVSARNGIIKILGNSTIAFSRGFYDYLKNACNSQITWSGSNLNIPSELPDYESGKITSPYPLRLYYNVCTFGYTTAFWNWERWERELDWMALHGINMPLAMIGQEAVWQKVWNSHGISNEALQNYFTGPAFLPWHRMGNINKHAGPLPQSWINNNKELQKKILNRMRELGMKPVVPAFSGFVPKEFADVHKDANIIKLAPWTGFDESFGTYILHPNSQYFREIGKQFIELYKKEYGEVSYYLADSFNELKVPVSEERRYEELADFGNAVYESIRAGDPAGIWVMQGWLFYNDSQFWDQASVKALLSKIPDDQMIIIDLANEYFEGWKQHEGFYGKKWIYSIIHNFGGSTKLFGDLEFLSEHPSKMNAFQSKGNLSGFGLSPEGIENNEVVYELLTDIAWTRDAFNIYEWLSNYSRSRYGGFNKDLFSSWGILNKNIYASFSLTNVFLYQRRPSVTIRHSNADPEELFSAASLFLKADTLKYNPLYRSDLADIIGNLAGYKIDRLIRHFISMHKLGETVERDIAFHDAKRLADKLDMLMGLQPNRSLVNWIDDARRWGSGPAEKNYFESNAKLQVTVWGGPYLSEYAAKVWSGLIKDYYFARWERLYDSLRTGSAIDLSNWEENWINEPYVRESQKDIDLIQLSKEILSDVEKINAEQKNSIIKILPDTLVSDKNLVQGIRARYYEGSWENLPDFSKEKIITDTLIYNINLGFEKRNADYGIQFLGILKITEPGRYILSLQSDDGSKLFINNKEIIDNDGLHAPEEQVAEVDLKEGFYHIRVDFFQRGGGKNLKFYYKTSNTMKEEIPGDILFHQEQEL